ncbi:hypothetical protein N7530_009585 [Penicillium desertorum]|uniref:Uncharacterized protein n=1 Tax=Penicillium desertorum TaxID=1303715 RepID=A0A9W9WIQ6_9EURO|nr:hypothetical protein N7530_009585 [Penicillium desertorum]
MVACPACQYYPYYLPAIAFCPNSAQAKMKGTPAVFLDSGVYDARPPPETLIAASSRNTTYHTVIFNTEDCPSVASRM